MEAHVIFALLVTSLFVKVYGTSENVAANNISNFNNVSKETPSDDEWFGAITESDTVNDVLLTAIRILDLKFKRKISNIQRKTNKVLKAIHRLRETIIEGTLACRLNLDCT